MRAEAQVKNDNVMHSQLLDIRDKNLVIKEVKHVISMINHKFIFNHFDKPSLMWKSCSTANIRDTAPAIPIIMIFSTHCMFCWRWRACCTERLLKE